MPITRCHIFIHLKGKERGGPAVAFVSVCWLSLARLMDDADGYPLIPSDPAAVSNLLAEGSCSSLVLAWSWYGLGKEWGLMDM